jgi:N-acetylglucosaminyl-diphospho-decaprenol L-rhamnosyltransferase
MKEARDKSLTQPPRGTISVVSHGHGDLLRLLLCDIASQSDACNWLVIITLNVAENLEKSELFGLNARIVHNKTPLGFAANHNAAAQISEGRIFIVCNPDIRIVEPHFLSSIAARSDLMERPTLFAPKVVSPKGEVEDSVRENITLPRILGRLWSGKSGWELDINSGKFFWLAGMFLVADRKFFKMIGGFDPQYHLYCEDYDLSARWWLAGGEIRVLDDLKVIHDARRSSKRSLRHFRWHINSMIRTWLSAPFWRILFSDK